MRSPEGAHGRPGRLHPPVLGRLSRYVTRLDLALIAVLVTLHLTVFNFGSQPGALALDLAACGAAILTTWRPWYGIAALTTCLAGYLMAPIDWQTVGQYAPLVAMLGTGLRGQRRELRTLTAVAVVLLPALVYYRAEGQEGPIIFRGWLAWLGLIATAWLIGNSFATVVRAREERLESARRADRQALARELHDSAARTLALTSLRAQRLQSAPSAAGLDEVIDGIDLANQQLRWTLNMMKDPEPAAEPAPSHVPLVETLQTGVDLLRTHGYEVILTVHGNLADLDPGRAGALADAANEAVANMVRHGDPSRPSSIMATVEPQFVELVFLNHSGSRDTGSGNSMGLAAVQDRLQTFGGRLDTQQGSKSWLTRVVMPRMGSGSRVPS
ncbi:MAG: histidine kinase [Propionicimonas sp.]